MAHVEAHELTTPTQLFKGMRDAGVPVRIASDITKHEMQHDAAYQRAEGVDGKGVSGARSFGFYFNGNEYYFNVTAYFEPNNWGELSYKDVEDIALEPPDPSGADLNTASRARTNRIRKEERDRVDRLYLRNEIEKRMDYMVEQGNELTYEELLLNYGNLIERNEEFVESTLEKAKEKALLRQKEEEKIGVEVKPVLGTILVKEDLELLHGQKNEEEGTQFREGENDEESELGSDNLKSNENFSGEEGNEEERNETGLIYKAKQT